MFLSPVGLEEDAVDLLEVDGPGSIADGFEHCRTAEVAGSP